MTAIRPSAPREWDAASYHRISTPQVRWGTALLGSVTLRGDERAVDGGCGTGLLTERLLERLPVGRVLGVDRSMAMAAMARRQLQAAGRRFAAVQADLCALPLPAAGVDLYFSTATFHWIHDQARLFADVARVLRPGGRLVAQCGGAGNLGRLHHWAQEVMELPEMAPHFTAWQDPWHYPTAEEADARLRAVGLVVERCELHEEPTHLDGQAAYAEFLRTVVLRTFLARLPAAPLQDRFLAAVTARAAATQPAWALDYVRLTMLARKPE